MVLQQKTKTEFSTSTFIFPYKIFYKTFVKNQKMGNLSNYIVSINTHAAFHLLQLIKLNQNVHERITSEKHFLFHIFFKDLGELIRSFGCSKKALHVTAKYL